MGGGRSVGRRERQRRHPWASYIPCTTTGWLRAAFSLSRPSRATPPHADGTPPPESPTQGGRRRGRSVGRRERQRRHPPHSRPPSVRTNRGRRITCKKPTPLLATPAVAEDLWRCRQWRFHHPLTQARLRHPTFCP